MYCICNALQLRTFPNAFSAICKVLDAQMWLSLLGTACNEILMLCGLGASWSTFVLKPTESARLKSICIPQLGYTNIPKSICAIRLFFSVLFADGGYGSEQRLEAPLESPVACISLLILSILIAFIFRMKKWYIEVVGPAWHPGELCLII